MPKTPQEILAECHTQSEISEACRQMWAGSGLADIQPDGMARFREEPTTKVQDPEQIRRQAQEEGTVRQAVRLKDGSIRIIEAMSYQGLDIYMDALRRDGKI